MKKTLLAGLLILGFSSLAAAADVPEYELVCRSKAKEIAAETYRGCVVEARTTQIDQLKKDYQDRLRSMKEEYQRQLKQLSTGKATSSKSETTQALPKKSAKSSKKVAAAKLAPVKKAADNAAVEEMTVELKTAPQVNTDDSTLDIPEPTPIENVPTTDAAAI